jgi:hypothetical protein
MQLSKGNQERFCLWHPNQGYLFGTASPDAQTCGAKAMRMGLTAGRHLYEVRDMQEVSNRQERA